MLESKLEETQCVPTAPGQCAILCQFLGEPVFHPRYFSPRERKIIVPHRSALTVDVPWLVQLLLDLRPTESGLFLRQNNACWIEIRRRAIRLRELTQWARRIEVTILPAD